MNKEEITYKIPNNQIHISEIKDEDCLIWISPKALYMANTIDELQHENQKYKEVIDKLKTNIENDIDGFRTINEFGESNEILELLDIYLDILKEVSE